MSQEQFTAQLREVAKAEPETAPPTPTTEPPAPETEPPGTAAPDPEAAGLPEPEAETPPEPKGTKEILADKGVELPDLYELKVPGTDLTFGQMKDAAPDLADISRLKLDIEHQRDEVTRQHNDYSNQLQAAITRLSAKFGEAEVAGVLEQAPADVEGARERAKAELQRWKPELSDPAAWSQAQNDIAEIAAFYELPAQGFASAAAGLSRMALRLHQLEGYLDTLRNPEKPPKQVRSQSKPKTDTPRGRKPRKPSANRGLDKFKAEVLSVTGD